MKVSILIPTCYRKELLREMLNSLLETTKFYDIETVMIIDEDEESAMMVKKKFWMHLHGTLDYSPVRRGALFSWNTALANSTGDILVPAGDDQIFHANWLEYALESHQTHCKGFGVVGMNDLAYDGNKQLATMFLFDRTFCKDVMGGIFAPPVYKYFCVDSEWNAKAKSLGHFYWDERAVVEHLHSAHGKRPVDDLDREKMDAGWMELDNKTFEDRKEKGFPITWTSLL